ncbi:unnamed protein product [Lymnaea stagnalis]|uniref:Uncharacterized protein n=1 Tax=Lymnaea stagnalis TaxID=6523 RepID=A0AAV2I3L9_LYMST
MSFKWMVLFSLMVAKCTAAACNNGQLGDTNFHCYNQAASFCSILNDPTVNTFNKEHAKVNILGTVKVAEFSAEKPTEQGTEKCSVTVWAVSEVVLGKIFIGGFRARIIRQDASTGFLPSFYEFEVKKKVLIDGVGRVTIEWTAGYRTSPSAPFNFRYNFVSRGTASSDVLSSLGDCDISYTLDWYGFFILEFPCCHLRVGFRPNIPTYRHQLLPGIWVEVNDPNIQFPNWTPGNEPLCLTNGAVNISSIQKNTGAVSAQEALTQLAFTNAGNVTLDGTPPNFAALAENLDLCSGNATRRLFADVLTILGSPKLVRCIADGIQEVLVSFLVLLENWICVNDSESCNRAKAILLGNCSSVSPSTTLNALFSAPC